MLTLLSLCVAGALLLPLCTGSTPAPEPDEVTPTLEYSDYTFEYEAGDHHRPVSVLPPAANHFDRFVSLSSAHRQNHGAHPSPRSPCPRTSEDMELTTCSGPRHTGLASSSSVPLAVSIRETD
ncbi:hypothetical protein NFI96_011130 [Prochilodus magdalenae]|nr:hypothetical protein NFI96_011130 [Prochilodus magdalenae]